MRNCIIIVAIVLASAFQTNGDIVVQVTQGSSGPIGQNFQAEAFIDGQWIYVGQASHFNGISTATLPAQDTGAGGDIWIRFEFDSNLIAQYDNVGASSTGTFRYDEDLHFFDSTWGPSSFQDWVPPSSVGQGSSGGGSGGEIDTANIEAALERLEIYGQGMLIAICLGLGAVWWRMIRLSMNEGRFL